MCRLCAHFILVARPGKVGEETEIPAGTVLEGRHVRVCKPTMGPSAIMHDAAKVFVPIRTPGVGVMLDRAMHSPLGNMTFARKMTR